MKSEPLRKKILKEMVLSKNQLKYIKMIWHHLPIQFQTYENFELIENFVKEGKL